MDGAVSGDVAVPGALYREVADRGRCFQIAVYQPRALAPAGVPEHFAQGTAGKAPFDRRTPAACGECLEDLRNCEGNTMGAASEFGEQRGSERERGFTCSGLGDSQDPLGIECEYPGLAPGPKEGDVVQPEGRQHLLVVSVHACSTNRTREAIRYGSQDNSPWRGSPHQAGGCPRRAGGDLTGTPGRNRTCAHGLGNHCSIH